MLISTTGQSYFSWWSFCHIIHIFHSSLTLINVIISSQWIQTSDWNIDSPHPPPSPPPSSHKQQVYFVLSFPLGLIKWITSHLSVYIKIVQPWHKPSVMLFMFLNVSGKLFQSPNHHERTSRVSLNHDRNSLIAAIIIIESFVMSCTVGTSI